MGIVTAHAPKLVVIAGILILAIRELCNHAMELLGLCKEPSCSGNGNGLSLYTVEGIADDGFQYPYQQLMQATAAAGSSCSNAAAMARASLVPLVYKGKTQCARFAILCREAVSEMPNPKSDSGDTEEEEEEEEETLKTENEGQEGIEQATEDNCEGFECAVCLSEFEIGQELKITPNCGHVFHSDCIHRWVELDLHDHRTTCPLCRTSLLSSGALMTRASSSPSLIAGF